MELTAQELRIGNYLNYQGKIIKVEGIHNRTIYHSDRQFDQVGVEKYITFEPIPLTEEWLFKFGFGKSEEHEYGSNENDLFGFYYDYHFNRFYLDTPEDNIYIPFIKYVHQLQNLYHCLCGNELQINSTKTTR